MIPECGRNALYPKEEDMPYYQQEARVNEARQLERDAFGALHTCLVSIMEAKAGGFWQAGAAMTQALTSLESVYRTASENLDRLSPGNP